MRLRLLARADLETIRRLRNDNREWFFDSREISEASQLAWFESLDQQPVTFYVIEMDGRVVGTVSVSGGVETREIGNLTLDQAYRGRGLMRQAVAQLTTDPAIYIADVKTTNEASLRVFRATGFTEEPAGNQVRFRKRVG